MNRHININIPRGKTAVPFHAPVQTNLLQRKCACGGTPGVDGECAGCRARRQATESQAANVTQTPGMPPVVGEVLRSPGQPLDPATRAFMEPRFGHDFSQVRVHTDSQAAESAREVDALAYTVGQHVVFGTGQYQPHTLPGRALFAHELAHTIQQQGTTSSSGAESPALEHAANQAALSVTLNRPASVRAAAAPPIQYLKVSQGGFGRALEEYTNIFTVPDKAVRLLQRSPTFMRLVSVLDKNYVWHNDSAKFSPEYGPDDRITGGLSDKPLPASMKGKRELLVVRGEPSFQPLWSPDNLLSADLIVLNANDVSDFIQQIAHEATHASRFAGTTPPAPQTLVDEINAGIKEEAETRASEATILGEIPDKTVSAQFGPVGSQVPADVERDISPAFMMTYLENSFFSARLSEAQQAEKLTMERATEIRKEVDGLVGKSSFPLIFDKQVSLFVTSKYADVWFDRSTVQEEWKAFNKQNSPTDPGFAAAKEKLLQDHATRFFKGLVSYRPKTTP